jgi:hypothetical protein
VQAKAAAEAEEKRRQDALERERLQAQAEERLRLLEEAERRAEECCSGRPADSGGGKEHPQERGWAVEGQVAAGPAASKQHGTQGSNAAGLTPEEYRKQLREVELRVRMCCQAMLAALLLGQCTSMRTGGV